HPLSDIPPPARLSSPARQQQRSPPSLSQRALSTSRASSYDRTPLEYTTNAAGHARGTHVTQRRAPAMPPCLARLPAGYAHLASSTALAFPYGLLKQSLMPTILCTP